MVILVFVAFGGAFAPLLAATFGGLNDPVSAVAVAVLAVALVSYLVYRTMLPSRTATGSALTLRTESFRRFLEGSEGRHVEWAWDRGVVRNRMRGVNASQTYSVLLKLKPIRVQLGQFDIKSHPDPLAHHRLRVRSRMPGGPIRLLSCIGIPDQGDRRH